MNLNDVETYEKQQKILDSWARTELTDVDKVKQELDFLLDVKRDKFYSDIAFFQKKYVSLIHLAPDAFKFSITIPVVEIEKLNKAEDAPIKKAFGDIVKDFDADKKQIVLDLVLEICKNRKQSEEELHEMAKTDCVYLQNFPQLVKIAISYEIDRQSEFRQLSATLLEKIKQVQQKEITQEQLSKSFLQKTLTEKFYSMKK